MMDGSTSILIYIKPFAIVTKQVVLIKLNQMQSLKTINSLYLYEPGTHCREDHNIQLSALLLLKVQVRSWFNVMVRVIGDFI